MRILYDHQMFSIQKYGGIPRYFCEILRNFPPEHQFILSLIFSDNYYLREYHQLFKKKNILPDKKFRGKHFLKTMIYSLNKQYSSGVIKSNKFDLFHPTFYDTYFMRFLRKPFVITVHDLIIFRFNNCIENQDLMKTRMSEIIRKANRIIAISGNTRNDLVDLLNIRPEKIDVIYHGHTPGISRGTSESQDYILFVGARESYKNFERFAISVSRLLIREKDLRLICVGAAFSKNELEFLARLGIRERTKAMSVDDIYLSKLYSNALVFVFPSLYEGFGLPILEAFANDCPVCLSDTACFREVAGEAAIYFDPNDPDSILSAVEKVIYDRDFASNLTRAGRSRLKYFEWSDTVQATFETYKKSV